MSNPLTAERKARVLEVAKEVSETFGKNYLLSFKDVMLSRAIKKHAKKEAKAAKKAEKAAKAESGGEHIKARPRGWKKGKDEKVRKDELQVEIVSWEELSRWVDPYVVYTINASLGDDEAVVYRRFSDFKKLHKKVGKKCKGAALPPASSKFGKRNLEYEFLRERRRTLNEYLEALMAMEGAAENKKLLKWLGLGLDHDKVLEPTFEGALEQTRWDLWNWEKIVYDKEADGFSQLVVSEAYRAIRSDVEADLPSVDRARKLAMKLVHKGITASCKPVATAAYTAAREAVEKLKDPVKKTLKDQLAQVLEVRSAIKQKLSDVMASAIAPILDTINDLVGSIVESIAAPIMDGLAEHAAKRGEFSQRLEAAIAEGDVDKVTELETFVSDAKEEVNKSLDAKIQAAMEPILGEFSSKLSVGALKSMLTPLERTMNIVEGFFDLIDPRNQLLAVKAMVEHKKTIASSSPTEMTRQLDREEWDIYYWKIWRSNWNIRNASWKVRYNLRREFPDLSPVTNAFYRFTDEAVDVNRRTLKKFSWRFGDHLHHHAKDMADGDEAAYQEAVDTAFLFGYQEASAYAWSKVGGVGRNFIRGILENAICGPIQKEVMPKVEGLLEPIEGEIPGPLADVLAITSLVTEAIDDTIQGSIDSVLDRTLGGVHEQAVSRGLIQG